MRIKISLLFTFLLLSVFNQAQVKNYVNWSFSQKKISACEYELQFNAKIDQGWHLYSQIETPDGPLPTVFEFEKNANYELIGKTIEPKPIEQAEPVFDNAVLRFFESKANFKQKIKILKPGKITIKGYIDGMVCNETQCQKISPPVDFEITINASDCSVSSAETTKPVNEKTEVKQETNGTNTNTALVNTDTSTNINNDTSNASTIQNAEIKKQEKPIEKKEEKSDAWYIIFLAGFAGGFLALLTPCVFPMIPMTVSFFTKQSKTRAMGIRNALIYSISIIVIYVVLGLSVTLTFGADALNNLSTNVWFNIFFFLLLVVFAISFLGAFEIVLPSSFVNKVDAQSERGGLIGIFFMAFTLGLVSFSCTGPIIGTLLVQAASTGAVKGPFWGMFGFSLALALPFGLFAAFPGWLNTLPKSGGWLNSVKVSLGFLELALALKFASNADLVVQAGILTRELFITLWIAIFGMWGIYLMGWFKTSHDSEVKHVSTGRLVLAIMVFSFTIYLIPGLWGAPLKLISGFPPPDFYSESPQGFGGQQIQASNSGNETKLAEHMHNGPNGIPAFDDYYHALEYSKKVNKPILIDFTGWACVNCRKMEGQVWSDAEVKRKLSEEFILVSLYVDDKKDLPEELKKEVNWSGKNRTLKSIGDRWSYLQNNSYQSSTQPQYWIIDGNEKHYSDSTSYDPDIPKYIDWLNKGLEKFKAGTPIR